MDDKPKKRLLERTGFWVGLVASVIGIGYFVHDDIAPYFAAAPLSYNLKEAERERLLRDANALRSDLQSLKKDRPQAATEPINLRGFGTYARLWDARLATWFRRPGEILDRASAAIRTGDRKGGLIYYLALSERGNATAQETLCSLLTQQRPSAGDDAMAIYWCAAAEQRGSAKAANDLGVLYATARGAPQNEQRAFELFKAAANANLPIAEYNLASFYDAKANLTFVDPDPDLRMSLISKAAEANYAPAQDALAQALADDPKQKAEAERLYKEAAAQGYVESEFHLAEFYEFSDPSAAVSWLRKAGDAGNRDAKETLALAYFNGEYGFQKDSNRGLEALIMLADEYHDAQSFDLIATSLLNEFTPPQWARSLYWEQKAADAGDGLNAEEAALAYEFGLNARRNARAAVHNWWISANQDRPYGQCEIAKHFADGTGIRQSFFQAQKFLSLAEQQEGYNEGPVLDLVNRAGSDRSRLRAAWSRVNCGKQFSDTDDDCAVLPRPRHLGCNETTKRSERADRRRLRSANRRVRKSSVAAGPSATDAASV